MNSEHKDLMDAINVSGDYNDDIEATFDKAMKKFISTQSW